MEKRLRKKVREGRNCPHCNGNFKRVIWEWSPYGPVPIEKKCPCCEGGMVYIEVEVP